jgi:hypothetical protein
MFGQVLQPSSMIDCHASRARMERLSSAQMGRLCTKGTIVSAQMERLSRALQIERQRRAQIEQLSRAQMERLSRAQMQQSASTVTKAVGNRN